MFRDVLSRVAGLSRGAKVALAVGVLVALGVAVALSPLVAILALIALFIAILALAVQLLRRRSLRRWGTVAAASLVMAIVFGVLSGALYGGGQPPGQGERASSQQGGTTQETESGQNSGTTEPRDTSPERDESSSQAKEGPTAPGPENGGPANTASPDQPDDDRSGGGLAQRGEVVTVTRVVDGDTVEITPAIDGREDVRLIGIDTPETSSACGAQPLSGEAESFARSRLAGEKVALEVGAEEVDQYDRTLAYLYTSPETMFNKTILREGLAQVYTVPPNDRYEDELLAAQEKARAAGRGIWGLLPARQDNLYVI